MRVLIVEDVESMAKLLEHVVNGMDGFSVSGTAMNAIQARIECTRHRPDLVLLDEILPGESSVDLLQELRSQGLPVILVTGVQDPKHALPSGVLGRVAKPAWETLAADSARFDAAVRNLLR